MVRDAYGRSGGDVQTGVGILRRAALSEEFAAASGLYFDNDSGRFAQPHPDGLDPLKVQAVVNAIEAALERALTSFTELTTVGANHFLARLS